MRALRSLLFAPATRPERFERALASGADAICIDLEDATPPDRKAQARVDAATFLASQPREGHGVGVRVNAAESPWIDADLAAVGAASFIIAPKAADRAQIERVAELSRGKPVWPLIETAEGVMHAWEIAAAPNVAGILFGAFDYAADIGCDMSWDALLYARGVLAAACARARVQLLDAPFGDIRDSASLAESTRQAKVMGFTGRACIHPTQIPIVNSVFTPSAEDIEKAYAIIAALDAAHGGAAQLDGRLIDLPVALAARRVLARVRT